MHTKGPWITCGDIDGRYSIRTAADHRVKIATICRGTNWEPCRPGAGADARLIAASPELLEACKEAFDELRLYDCHQGLARRVRAAIWKAEGKVEEARS